MSSQKDIDRIADWLVAIGFPGDWNTTTKAPVCLMEPIVSALLRSGGFEDRQDARYFVDEEQEFVDA